MKRGEQERTGPFRRRLLVAAPFMAVAFFLAYLWFVSGVIAGVEEYPNGRIKARGYIKRHGLSTYRRQGAWVSYHENGRKASEGFYEAGRKVGEWTYWDAEGNELPAASATVADFP